MMDDSGAYDAGDPKAPGYADTMRERADVWRKEVRGRDSRPASN